MDFIKLATKRRSVRQYSAKPVSNEQLLLIAEAGRLAPSAVNYQPWDFFVVTSTEGLKGLYESYNREWFCQCKHAIVVCSDKNQAWVRKSDNQSFGGIDAAIAIDHMTLQAAEMGIGSCWICNFDPVILRQNLPIEEHIEPIAIIALGFPVDPAIWDQSKKRKELDRIIKWI